MVGVFLRFVEIVLEERFDIELKPYTYGRLEPVTLRLRSVSNRLKERLLEYIAPYLDNIKGKLGELRGEDSNNEETEIEELPGSVLDKLSSPIRTVISGLRSYSVVKEVYVCEECGSRFGSRRLLQEHREEDHS